MRKTRNDTGNGIDLVKGYSDGGLIAICITGIVYLALLYSVILYLE